MSRRSGRTMEEVLRLVFEVTGTEGVDATAKAFANLGNVSEDTVRETEALLDSLDQLKDTARKAAAYGQLADELARSEKALDEASTAAYQLGLQLAATEKPSRQLVQAQKAARSEVDRLQASVAKQWEAFGRADEELGKLGVNTSDLAAGQQELRDKIARTTGEIDRQAGSITREAAAVAQLRARMQEGDERFRRFAQSGTVSAEALARYRDRARESAEQTRRLGGDVGRTGSAFGRLRSLIAPVLGFLTFREAARGVKALAQVAQTVEDTRRSLSELYGSQEAGNRAYADLEVLSKRNGLAMADVVEQARKLKAFGLDPLNGSLQALIDQNAAAGGSQEDLAGKVLALGQAFAKQKFQGEEILQLVERGVPVWDLLQKATGKNVTQLQKLSSEGKLGRDVIRQLYEEMGRASAGAATRSLGSLRGLIAQASAGWLKFKQDVVAAGVGDYLKQQFSELLAATGGMGGLAKRVSEGIISSLEAIKRFGLQLAPVFKAVGEGALVLARNAEAVLFLAKTYATLKLVQLATQFSALTRAKLADAAATRAQAAATGAHATASTGLLGALRSLPTAVRIGVALLGVDLAVSQMQQLAENLREREAAAKQVEAFERRQRELQGEQLNLGRQLQQLYRDSAGVAIKGAAELKQLTEEQTRAYQAQLEAARQFYAGVIREARATGEAQKEAAAVEHFKALGGVLDQVGKQLDGFKQKAAEGNAIAKLANDAGAEFDKLIAKGRSLSEAVSGAFDGIDLSKKGGLREASAILDEIGARGAAAGAAIQSELVNRLAQLPDEQLPALKRAVADTFGTASAEARRFQTALNSINTRRLGVDIEAIKTGFTAAGRAAVQTFEGFLAEIRTMGLTAQQQSEAVAQGFASALGGATTKKELDALKKALVASFGAGEIAADAFYEKLAQIDAALAGLGNRRPGAGLTENLRQMGDQVEHTSQELQDLDNTVEGGTDGIDEFGNSVDAATDYMGDASKEGESFALALYAVNDAALDAYMATNKYAGMSDVWRLKLNGLTEEINRQGEALNRQVDALNDLAEGFDEMAGRRQQLRDAYNFLGDSEIEKLLQAEQRLSRIREQRSAQERQSAEARQREREAEVAAAQQASGGPSGNGSVQSRVRETIVVRLEGGAESVDLEADAEVAERLTRVLQHAARRSNGSRRPY